MVNSNFQYQNSLPDYGAYTKTKFSSDVQYSRSVTTDPQGQGVSVSARVSTSVSYTETRYTPTPYQTTPSQITPLTYQAPQPPAANAIQSNSEPATSVATANVETDPIGAERNLGAAAILAFVEQRLVNDLADGFTQEELQSRIQAGFDGFSQGFGEAVVQLKTMGLYEGAAKDAVEQTFNQVATGFAELADKYGLENPAAQVELFKLAEATQEGASPEAAPAVQGNTYTGELASPIEAFQPLVENVTQNQDVKNLQTLIAPTQDFYSVLEEEQSASRNYSLSLRTADGDVVSIRSYADQGALQRTESGPDGSSTSTDTDSLQDFQFSVKGELDSSEMTAITDLLSQLNDVADQFFEGNLYDAFQNAQNVGFDSDQIARFSLNLRQVEYSRIEQAYGSVAQADVNRLETSGDTRSLPAFDNQVSRLSDFIQQLDDLRKNAVEKGFSESDLPRVSEFVGRRRHEGHPHFGELKPFVGQMLKSLRGEGA